MYLIWILWRTVESAPTRTTAESEEAMFDVAQTVFSKSWRLGEFQARFTPEPHSMNEAELARSG